jgi:Fe-S-cluster containining protein
MISDQSILQAVTEAYARFDARAARWSARFTREGGRVHCASGCFHCCNLPIQVSLAEALLLASSLSSDALSAVRAHAKKVIANARTASSWNEYTHRHRANVGFCPLLDASSGTCTVYSVRPARCRDTLSAFESRFCQLGTLEGMTRRERVAYDRMVAANPVTDGSSHYIAPLEVLGEDIWDSASRAMRSVWGLEVWGDFWVLTTLTQDAVFMGSVRAGRARDAVRRARALGLWHVEIVRVE